jgi:hypothetical protein
MLNRCSACSCIYSTSLGPPNYPEATPKQKNRKMTRPNLPLRYILQELLLYRGAFGLPAQYRARGAPP